jgi:hypothetical protein
MVLNPVRLQCRRVDRLASYTHIVYDRADAIASSLSTRIHGPLYSSFIRPSQQDSLLYTQFSRTHPSPISSPIHSIHCETHLSLYLNISMCDLVLKDLLR